ncbi:diguanylate cyclase [Alteromonas sp. D210916BOD_24]|uniref:sensor domain-containing diguanylate cyclase n=1 Tax=Alteromonas sp. D210916BOD_24 TaxID=3157618 RepID=UPI00399C9607
MRINLKTIPKYDASLIAITLIVILTCIWIALKFSPETHSASRYSQLVYLTERSDNYDFTSITQVPQSQWSPISSPINMGMNSDVHWFSLVISPTQSTDSRYILHVDYPLLDILEVGVYSNTGRVPIAQFAGGDKQPFTLRPIGDIKPAFPLPLSEESQRVYIKVQTEGTVRLPIRIWEEKEFMSYVSGRNLALGIFFGVLVAMGVSNALLTFAARNSSFLHYAGYVLSLALTLASLHGFGYAYLWPDNTWLQSKSILIFSNATIMFAAMFTRSLLPIKEYSVILDKVTQGIGVVCALNMIFSVLLPYHVMLKISLFFVTIIVSYTVVLGLWLSFKGVAVARYFTIAWAFLLGSAMSASFDNANVIELPISSNNLLIIGGAVETLILAVILAINYSHSREDLITAQQFALEQEKQANIAKENLLEVQKRYQDDLEYKVEERTLELEITLRELSEVNQELERLNAIDPLTGVHNRRHFDKRLRSEGRRSRREQTPLSLAIVDIDHFKQINDEYGHDGGDECLIHATRVFQQLLQRPTDDLCRIGGEEFAIILPNTDLEGAHHVVESMREELAITPVMYNGERIVLTASAGVSTTIITDEEHSQVLFRHADELLYQAKSAGRNNVKFEYLQEKS